MLIHYSMFQDVDPRGVYIESSGGSGEETSKIDAETDALPLERVDRGVPEEPLKVSSEVQTDAMDESRWSGEDCELPASSRGLEKITSLMLSELGAESCVGVFEELLSGFGSGGVGRDAEVVFSVGMAVEQPREDVRADDEGEGEGGGEGVRLACTGVSWSCTGSRIFASFGASGADGWDTTRSGLGVWRVGVSEVIEVLSWPCSLQCVAAHPNHPGIVACGAATGEVVVWGVGVEGEQVLGVGKGGVFGHRQPVTDLEWVRDPGRSRGGSEEHWLLLSCASDGLVLAWSLKNKLSHPVAGLLLRTKDGGVMSASVISSPTTSITSTSTITTSTIFGGSSVGAVTRASLRHWSRIPATSRAAPLTQHSGPCVSSLPSGVKLAWTEAAAALVALLPSSKQADLVANAEKFAQDRHSRSGDRRGGGEGGVFSSSSSSSASVVVFPQDVLSVQSSPSSSTSTSSASSGGGEVPTVFTETASDMALRRHNGGVTAICTSAVESHAIASVGTDGDIKLHSDLSRTTPIVMRPAPPTVPLTAATWSPHRAMLLVVGDGSGIVHAVDLSDSTTAPLPIPTPHTPLKPSQITLVPLQGHARPVSDNPRNPDTIHQVPHSLPSGSNTVLHLAFNPTQRRMVAAATADGIVHIITLPWDLAEPKPADNETLQSLVRQALD